MRHHNRSIWTSAAVVVAACAIGCSPDPAGTAASSGSSDSNGNGASGPGQGGGSSGDGGAAANVSVGVGPGVGGGQQQGAFVVEPQNPSLDIELGTPGQTVQFSAVGASGPVHGVAWFLSTPEAGTISAEGLFTSNGQAGGQITVGAKLDGDSATTLMTLNLHAVENPAGLSQADQDTLTNPAPGQVDPSWSLWYPYANTVFPRGIPAPSWQSATGAQMPSAWYLKITGTHVAYEGFLAASGQNARPGQAAWDAIGSATDGGDMTVEIAKLVGGVKYGPVTSAIRVARGSLKGTIYYNTYDSQLAGGTGAIMRIRGNSTTPEVLLGNCVVCHSVASDGSTIAASQGGTFDLGLNPDAPPSGWTDVSSSPEIATFAGLYPIGGELLVTNGTPGEGYPPNTPGSGGPFLSTLRMRNGTVIPNSGIEPYYAQTPVFSHDGTRLAFYDRPAGGGTGALVVMDFDYATKTFTNRRVIATPPSGRHYSWPAFTPDGQTVIYQDGAGDDLATWFSNTGVLRGVNVETLEPKALENLNGDAYLPQGTRDQNLNYEPTILPIASGGYFWVMFTSRRTYGNTLLEDRGLTKRLWVSAYDLNAPAGTDPSHAAFYIEGQEIASGNSRGFWALDPCRQDGDGCESGDQCCNGFCNPSADDPNVFECGQPDGTCSDEFEACETAADCCDPSMDCINGRCAQDDPVPN